MKEDIQARLKSYRNKYYLNLCIRGIFISLALILSIFLLINTLEYTFHFGSIVRATLLFGFIGCVLYAMILYIVKPVLTILNKTKGLTDEDAAQKIGDFFPAIGDKLLNMIQLQKQYSPLAKASIQQKNSDITQYDFTEAVDIQQNKQYLTYLAAPLLLITLIITFNPAWITHSSERLIKFNTAFVPEAPFNFTIKNEALLAYKNEDFTVSLQLEGAAIPATAYIIVKTRKTKMTSKGNGNFEYTFKKIQHRQVIQFSAAGFSSANHNVHVVDRPALKNFNVYLGYPAYLNRKNERLTNVGNIRVPQGTKVQWQLSTLHADTVLFSFGKERPILAQNTDNQLFEYGKNVFKSEVYNISMKNNFSKNTEKIIYNIDVISDEYPQITLNVYQDTLLYNYIVLGGNIIDDYGLRKLKLNYQLINKGKEEAFKTVNIPISNNQTSQQYYYQWFLDSLNIKEGNTIKYYLQVWDNDGINGQKSTKTGIYTFQLPSKKKLKQDLEEAGQKTEKDLDKRIKDAKELHEKIKNVEERLKGKKELSWEDKSLLKDILQKKEDLNKALEDLKKQNRDTELKRERFSAQNEKIKEKVEQLQKLTNELLDEETKKLYEELQRLLEKDHNLEDIQDNLEKLQRKENNLEKELERTLELYKRMKFDILLEENIQTLKEQAQKQEKLSEETDSKKITPEKALEKQEELNEAFETLEEDLEKTQELNQELNNPEAMPNLEKEKETIKQEQQKAKEALENNKKKKAKEAQEKAGEEMQKMAEEMQKMQNSMEMSMMEENEENLRYITDNLITLSFDQEKLMEEFNGVKQGDPRFVDLSQKQLKLKDDAQIVEDSLLSLAKRVFQIASFVTKEVDDMNEHIDKSVDAIKERKKEKVVSEQQFTMTAMNNLALLLDDVLDQMQSAMQEAKGNPKKGKQKTPSLGELQQQLNEKIEELKKSGKSGRQLSEELAKLASEQERIREALQEMQQKEGKGENGKLLGDGIPEKMEKTEIDLVNKQITQETIQRQREILTRLLEAENALREREQEEERKGETAKDYEKEVPRIFEEYLRQKEKEVELLKTVPPKLYPYYKKEVSEYFKRLNENGQH